MRTIFELIDLIGIHDTVIWLKFAYGTKLWKLNQKENDEFEIWETRMSKR